MVVLFVMAVLGIVLAVDLAVLALFGWNSAPGEKAKLLVAVTVITSMVIGLGSLYRMASLRGGGETVALQMGGIEVPRDTTDLSLRRLRNVVEEMAIASGVPVPGIYVMEHEAGINAFAAGYSTSDAVVAVTRGALDRLNRDELQGVIAHEFSHVLNGDMRLNIRLMGGLFGILMLSVIGQRVLQMGSVRSRNAGVIVVVGLVALVVGSIGIFFGRMIKAGVSRQRELLADASAVQFTRQTAGLAGALKKIGGMSQGSQLQDRANAEEVSHMLFGEGLSYSRLFATHPPLLERIRLLEPSFDARQLNELGKRWALTPPNGLQEDIALGLMETPHSQGMASLPSASGLLEITPAMVSVQVAAPDEEDYLRASNMAAAMPQVLRQLASERDRAIPLLLALILDSDEAVAQKQHREIVARLGDAVSAQVGQMRGYLADLHPSLRLPLAALAFPAMRTRPRPELESFMDAMEAVVHSDGRVSLFEYCLGQLLRVQVREALDPSRYARFGRHKPGNVKREFITLLAVVAQSGAGNRQQAQHAYLAGLQRVLPSDHMPYAPPAEGVLALDAVWGPLDKLDPLAKQVMVEALVAAASHDGRVTVAEAELLRTICGVLHCPLPPMLEDAVPAPVTAGDR